MTFKDIKKILKGSGLNLNDKFIKGFEQLFSKAFEEAGKAIIIANQPFPQSWMEASSMSDLIEIINSDENAQKGAMFLSTMRLSDLPAHMMQAEIKVEILYDRGVGDKIILFTITSEDTPPYHWEYTSAYGNPGTWRAFAPYIEESVNVN